VISGETGRLTCGMRTKFNRTVLNAVSPDAKYADTEEQFVVFDSDSEWFAVPGAKTKHATCVNGKELSGETKLNNGDKISLLSRSGSGKTAMILTVGFESM